jgi:hypothetical protein
MRYVTDHQYDEQYAIPETDEEADELLREERLANEESELPEIPVLRPITVKVRQLNLELFK